jgi:hypothetical protein
MALTGPEQTQLKALITREGGPAAFAAEVQALYVASTQANALTTLGPAISVTVQDGAVLQAYAAQASNAALYAATAAIAAKVAANDFTGLGPLLWVQYSAVKAHLAL